MAEKLTVGAIGTDVARLHQQLQRHSFEVPDSEVRRKFFGPGTREAVLACQREHGLTCSGEVDEPIATLLAGDPPSLLAGRSDSPGAATGARVTTIAAERGTAISGRCTDIDGAAVHSIEVRAFLRDPNEPDPLLGEAHTGDDGCYRIEVLTESAAYLNNPGGFMYIQAGHLGEVLGESDLTPARIDDVSIDLRLNVRAGQMAVGVRSRRVYGTLRDEFDHPLTGVTVLALDRDLQTETVLGQATAIDGQYEIQYLSADLRRGAKRGADLMISVVDGSDNEIHRTPIIFGVCDELKLDISIRPEGYRGPSEWTVRTRRLRALIEGVPPEELRESEEFGEISFLAGQTGWDKTEVADWIWCWRLAAKSAALAERVAPEVFYAFIASGKAGHYPNTFDEDIRNPQRMELLDDRLLETIVFLGTIRQRGVIEEAIDQRLIPPDVGDRIDLSLAAVDQLRRRFVAVGSFSAGQVGVADLIGLVPEVEARAHEILDALSDNIGSLESVLRDLAERHDVSHDAIRLLRWAFELAELTGKHLPLVANLLDQLTSGRVSSPRVFAELSRADWIRLVSDTDGATPAIGTPAVIDGYDPAQRAAAYAARLDWNFERQYPTTAFAAKLGRSVHAGRQLPRATAAVARFLRGNPDFELDRHQIDQYLAGQCKQADQVDGQRDLRDDLMAVQRVFRLQPTFEATETLLGLGLESSQQIYHLGERRFLDTLASSAVNTLDAQKIYRRAEETYGTALALYAEFNTGLNGVSPAAVPTWSMDDALRERIRGLPSLETLFGSQDYCECAHCQSLYSPAAYLLDLLRFLHRRATPQLQNYRTCLEVLSGRRPDLAEIELSCANTNTALPYIDLVNEVLEEDIHPRVASINTAFTGLAAGPITADLRQKLQAAYPTLGITLDARLEKVHNNRFVLRNEGSDLSLNRTNTNNVVEVRVRRQTAGVAADLRAAPEHINPGAYRRLAEAVFPLLLPFNLWDATARVHLEHLGVPQAQLLELLQTQRGAPAPTRVRASAASSMPGYQANTVGKMVDGDDATIFWSNRSAAVGDYVSVDLGTVKPVVSVTINMSKQDSPNDYIQNGALEHSVDGSTWRPAGTFQNNRDVAATLPAGTTARYVRLRCTQAQSPWVVVREFSVTALPSTRWRTSAASSMPAYQTDTVEKMVDSDDATFFGSGRSPAVGDYVSVDLGTVKRVESVTINMSKQDSPNDYIQNCVLEHSVGGSTWTPAGTFQNKRDVVATLQTAARYIRLRCTQAQTPWVKVREFTVTAPVTALTPSPEAIVQSRLGIADRASWRPTTPEDEFVTDVYGVVVIPAQWEYWGLSQAGNQIPNPDNPSQLVSGTWIQVLSQVPVMLHRGGLSFPQLQQLLDMRFVNPGGAMTISDQGGECDTSKMTISGLNAAALTRANGFIRLWRALGWQMWELDQFFNGLDAAVYDGTQWIAIWDYIPTARRSLIANTMRVREKTKLDWDLLASLYLGLNGLRYADRGNGDRPIPGVYERIFRRDAELASMFPADPRTLMSAIGDQTSAMRSALMSALQLSEPDLTAALQGLRLTATSPLNVDTLRDILALATLAKAAAVTTADMRDLLNLANPGNTLQVRPWDNPDRTIELVDTTTQLRTLGFTVAELADLLTPPDTIRPAAETRDVTTFITYLRESYAKTSMAPAAATTQNGQFVGSEDMEADTAATQRQLFIVESVATAVDLEVSSTDTLLRHTRNGKPTLLTVFDDTLAAPSISDALINRVGDALRGLRKSATVIKRLGARPADVQWWLTANNAATMGWPGLLTFPERSTDAPVNYQQWLALQRFAFWRSGFEKDKDKPNAFDFAAALTASTSNTASAEALLSLTGWHRDDFADTASHLGWQSTNANPNRLTTFLRRGDNLLRLTDIMAALSLLAVSANRAISWVTQHRGPGAGGDVLAEGAPQRVAVEIVQAARAKYSPDQWRTVSQPIQDKLREAKRRALVNYSMREQQLVNANTEDPNVRNWLDTAGLYGYFLIDVEMSPCQLTPRLLQASAAIQLFVQRCQLGLEAGITVDTVADPGWLQWQWMKNYRVWEANRKVFLYPENWLQPELRDEKSQPFTELEQELLQGEITAETAQQAYGRYLVKLDAVANLQPRATVRENFPNGDSVLHVIGRAQSTDGGQYYYRRNVNRARWTAWERIDLDISSDQLLAGVQNGRVVLMWPQFVEKALEPATIRVPGPNSTVPTEAPQRRLEVRVFVSEQLRSGWSPRTLADAVLMAEKFLNWPGLSAPGELAKMSLHGKPYSDHIVATVARVTSASARGTITAPWGPDSFVRLGKQIVTIYERPFQGDWFFSDQTGTWINNFIQHTTKLDFGMQVVNYYGAGGPPLPNNLTSVINVLGQLGSNTAFTVVESNLRSMGTAGAFFFFLTGVADEARTYFTAYEAKDVTGSGQTYQQWNFSIRAHYHPFVQLFAQQLARYGLRGLLNREIQISPHIVAGSTAAFDFRTVYRPAVLSDAGTGARVKSQVVEPLPTEEVDFDYIGAYSAYNWELFFHVPFLIGSKLATNQRFEEALQWFHYIFDPVGVSYGSETTVPQKFWITKPFFLRSTAEYQTNRIEAILKGIAEGNAQLRAQVREWRNNPFNPHLIARMRTVAYQKNVVIKYIQTLIAWGDYLFARDTFESVNEATQIYMIASSILGRRPRQVPATQRRPVRTYSELIALMAEGQIPDPLIDVENLIAPSEPTGGSAAVDTPALPLLNMFYFGLPPNDKLIGMWDLVDDRLFKIRNCMNLAGQVRQLPSFEPPIDPGLLAKARAAGLTIADAIAETTAPLPLQRFTSVLAQARAAVDDVKSLGAALASALEKRDAESIAVLRLDLESAVQQQMLLIRQAQIQEATRTEESLTAQRTTVQARLDHYRSLISQGVSVQEKAALDLIELAVQRRAVATGADMAAAVLGVLPDLTIGISGFGGSPHLSAAIGGRQLSVPLQLAATRARTDSDNAQSQAGGTTTRAGYVRREEDWNLQRTQAELELAQIDKQILAAQIRRQIAEKERAVQQQQIDNRQVEADFMQSKFTSGALYDWMIAQTSFVFFQGYQLALDLAKRAERCMRFELGLADATPNQIQGPHWDTLRKGLLAGERLSHDLRRLETAYHTQNQREYELTKHISLAQLNPRALLELRRSGVCGFEIPEVAFDMDHPGHYFRRIKSISLSIPCVVGPYTAIGANLALTRARIRKVATLLGQPGDADRYSERTDGSETRFESRLAVVNAIATSQAQQDAGVFQLDFNDPRYLPFEGAGAISEWRLTLNDTSAQFDLATISDVVVHMRYTAREATEAAFRPAASENTTNLLKGDKGFRLVRVLDIRHEYPDLWQRFVQTADPINLTDIAQRLPYITQSKVKKVRKVEVAASLTDNRGIKAVVGGLGNALQITLTAATSEAGKPSLRGLRLGSSADLDTALGNSVSLQLDPDTAAVQELFMIIHYTVAA